MREGGYFAQKTGSPTGLVMVILLHAAVLAALILIKGPMILGPNFGRTVIYDVPLPEDPPPVPPPPRDTRQPPRDTTIDQSRPVIPTRDDNAIDTTYRPPEFPGASGTGDIVIPPIHVDPPPPVRRAAEVDPAFRSALQPPYPPSEQRAEREGDVRVRVTIGANGRVIAIERLSATSDAFWQVTQRQALTRWRFRPATIDGRPVESTKVMNLHFQLQDFVA
jgi:protein TonB